MSPDQLAEKFCLVLKRRRKRLGLTQPQLAERLGVTRETISRIECGRKKGGYRTTLVLLAKLAEALEVNLGTLMREAEGFEE